MASLESCTRTRTPRTQQAVAASASRTRHRRSMPRKRNPRPPHHRRCPDCARGCTTAPLRLASCAPRHSTAFLTYVHDCRLQNRVTSTAILSVPAPTSNPTTTTPIPPQLCQSTGCSSYPFVTSSEDTFLWRIAWATSTSVIRQRSSIMSSLSGSGPWLQAAHRSHIRKRSEHRGRSAAWTGKVKSLVCGNGARPARDRSHC